jgi:ankyrin repeat protein
MLSVLANDSGSVESLLTAGADIDIRNNKREQAINLAELSGNTAIIDLILEHEKEKKLFGVF